VPSRDISACRAAAGVSRPVDRGRKVFRKGGAMRPFDAGTRAGTARAGHRDTVGADGPHHVSARGTAPRTAGQVRLQGHLHPDLASASFTPTDGRRPWSDDPDAEECGHPDDPCGAAYEQQRLAATAAAGSTLAMPERTRQRRTSVHRCRGRMSRDVFIETNAPVDEVGSFPL
jgi:hypothetical protein